MTLEQAIIVYGGENITSENDWYAWREINPALLPKDISLPAGNQYRQNVFLKNALSSQYHAGDDKSKFEVTSYYIATWGGVRSNKRESINFYAFGSPEDLIARGSQGIASWSKALCVRDPKAFAIYDARVALGINCLQIIFNVSEPELFPLLSGRNKAVIEGNKLVKSFASRAAWAKAKNDGFYKKYNAALSAAAKALGIEIYTLEMLLFSRTLSLLNQAIPEGSLVTAHTGA